jgi:hypothetical protein
MIFEGAEAIGDEIYLYRNFLTEQEAKRYTDVAESFDLDSWEKDPSGAQRYGHEFYELNDVLDKIKSIAPKGLDVEGSSTFTKMVTGSSLDVHDDECVHCSGRVPVDKPEKNSVCLKYGMVIYFSKFTGGEIFYPNQNITIQPNPGDLVIHSSKKECAHGVKEVKAGIRYTLAPYILDKNV